ncbi:MAG: methanogenesis marker 7 protein [archaeon]|nr:methanogenesis marker 7 protein [archaeon]
MFDVMMYDGGVYRSKELYEAIEDSGGVILQEVKSAQMLSVVMSIPREDREHLSKVCTEIGGQVKNVPLAGTEIAVVGCTLGRHHMPHPICDIAEEIREYGGISAVMGLARGRGKTTSQISLYERGILEEYDAVVFMLGNFQHCIEHKKHLFENIRVPVLLVCGPQPEGISDCCEAIISGVGRKAERMKSAEERKKLEEIGSAISKIIEQKKTILDEDPLFIHPAELKQLLEMYEPINMSLRPAPIVLHLDGLRVKIPYEKHKSYFDNLIVYGRKLSDIARISKSKINDSSTIIRIKALSEVEAK